METYFAHVVNGIGSIGGEGRIVITIPLFGEHEAEECGERLHFLENEGVAFIGDQSSLFMDLLAGPE